MLPSSEVSLGVLHNLENLLRGWLKWCMARPTLLNAWTRMIDGKGSHRAPLDLLAADSDIPGDYCRHDRSERLCVAPDPDASRVKYRSCFSSSPRNRFGEAVTGIVVRTGAKREEVCSGTSIDVSGALRWGEQRISTGLTGALGPRGVRVGDASVEGCGTDTTEPFGSVSGSTCRAKGTVSAGGCRV